VAGLDWAAAIGIAATPMAEILVLALRKPRARRDLGTGEFILEYGSGLKAFAVFAVGFFSFVGALYVWTFVSAPNQGGLSVTLILIVWVPLLLLSSVLGLEMFRSYARFSPTQIVRHSPWTGELSVDWQEVESIAYDNFAQWYVIRTRRGKIRLHQYLNGIEDFRRIARERVPPERWGKR
jgi:hypothetical protein